MTASLLTELIRRHEGIASPDDYFTGLRPRGLQIPKGVLVFSRDRDRGRVDRISQSDPRFVLVVNLSGRGDAILGDVRVALEPGHCLLIFPNQRHRFVHDRSRFSWLFISFALGNCARLEPLRYTPLAFPPICWDYLELLTREYSQEKHTDNALANRTALLTALILDAFSGQAPLRRKHAKVPRRGKTESALTDRAYLYIRGHLHEKLSVARMARHCSYSPSHFRSLYRRRMGISVGACIRNMKLSRAKELLASSDLNITEIAFATGYGSVYAFSRAFKKMAGSPPLAYRRMLDAKPSDDDPPARPHGTRSGTAGRRPVAGRAD